MKTFKIDDYTFNLTHKEDGKPELKINNKKFSDLMRKEMNGELNKDKEDHIYNKEEKNKKNRDDDDYYKRALQYNGEDYFEENENEIYNIEEKNLKKRKRKKRKSKKKKKKRKKLIIINLF